VGLTPDGPDLGPNGVLSDGAEEVLLDPGQREAGKSTRDFGE
jgi:hypothetical protein